MESMLSVRFATAVNHGGETLTHLDTTKDNKWKLELVDDFRIRITNNKTGRAVYSSLFNAAYWEMDEGPKRKKGRSVEKAQVEAEEALL